MTGVDLTAKYVIVIVKWSTKHTEGRLESHAISGLWIKVGWLWQEPLPAELECLQQILGSLPSTTDSPRNRRPTQ